MRSLTLFLCIVACSKPGSTTKGKRGVASFSYLATPGCEDGCDLDRNFVAADGAHQILSVAGAAFASAGSSAPQIATFTKVAAGVEAVTGAPGDADLTLLDAGGAEIDRVTVHVAAVATLDFMRGWMGTGPIILEGVPITMSPITKRDAGVRILLGSSGVHFSVTGTLTSLGPPPPADPAAPATIIESLIVQGTAGTAGLHGVNGAQHFDLPVTVVSPDELTHLSAVITATYLGAGGATIDSAVQWTVATPAGQVFGADCTWTVSDPSVFMEGVMPLSQLDRPPTGSLVFRLSHAGSFTATCTIGRLMVTIPLKRDS